MAKAVQNPGIAVRALVDEYQLSAAKVASDIKLSPSGVRLLLAGKLRISIPIALRLAKYFGTTVDYWIELQKKYDLVDAANDKDLSGILKGILKAKRPPAKKPAAEKKPVKAVKAAGKKTAAKAAAKPKAPRKPRAKKAE
jgi:addiction module HigA family antidote